MNLQKSGEDSFEQLARVLATTPSLDPDHSLVPKLRNVYFRARRCGRTGALAAQRLSIAANQIRRFAPNTLEGFISPWATAAGVEAEIGRIASILSLLRNAFLLVALLITGWYSWSTIIGYQKDLTSNPTDVDVPFISLWQTGFHALTWSLSQYVLVSTCIVVCAAVSGLIAMTVKVRARAVADRLGADLSNAVNDLTALSLRIESLPDTASPADWVEAMGRLYSNAVTVLREAAADVQHLEERLEERNTRAVTDLRATVSAFSETVTELRGTLNALGPGAESVRQSAATLNTNAASLSNAVSELLPAQRDTNTLLQQLIVDGMQERERVTQVAGSVSQLTANSMGTLEEVSAIMRDVSMRLERVSRDLEERHQAQALPGRHSNGWWPFRRRQPSYPPYPHEHYQSPLNIPQRVPVPATPQYYPSPLPAPATPNSGSAMKGSSTHPARPTTSEAPIQDPRFTAYIRREIEVGAWQTMVVYAHEAAAHDRVRIDVARRYETELGRNPRESTQVPLQQVERGTHITFMPICEGLIFPKDRESFKWVRDMHRAEFDFKADEHYAGESVNGRMLVFGGPVLIAALKFSVHLLPIGQRQSDDDTDESISSGVVTSIFASYSHEDEPVVVAVRNVCRSLRIQYNRDREALSAGQPYDPALLKLIEDSEYFQLFWSERAARSDYVSREWQHAIHCGKANGHFLPVYWDDSLYPLPAELDGLRLTFVHVRMPMLNSNDS